MCTEVLPLVVGVDDENIVLDADGGVVNREDRVHAEELFPFEDELCGVDCGELLAIDDELLFFVDDI